MTAAPALLGTEDLTLHAAGRCLVERLTWAVQPGQRWCVIGRNAAGKSTLLRALAGLSVPGHAGAVHWLGRPAQAWSPLDAAALRAYVPQHAVDRFDLSVRRLLELSALGLLAEPALQATAAALDVHEVLERPVTRLSGGERQRVALAQCAVQGARLMLLDEPVSFQDPAHQVQVARWLAGCGDAGLVFSAHDVNWLASAASHVLALFGDGGWAAGPVDEMLTSALLQRVYGCDWRREGALWMPA